MAKKDLREIIEQDLLKQLYRNGTSGEYFIDLVRDYMKLWDTKNKLNDDIAKRGVTVEYVSNNGTSNFKKNESVSEVVKVNNQMLKMLEAMGIEPSQNGSDDDEM